MGKFADELAPKFADSQKPRLADFKTGTIAWVIQRVIEDVDANPLTIKPYGESQRASLRRMQREPIGKIIAAKLAKQDVIDHCKMRRQKVCASTVKQDITFLRGVFGHASDTWADCTSLSLAAFTDSKRFLMKNQLIGKSTPRTRLPSADEIARLLDFFSKRDVKPRVKVKMVPVVAFGLVSARRRSEVCRITHGDVDHEKKIYWVRDLKHPTKKKGNDKSFVLWPALAQLIQMQPRMNPNDPTERIFPYNQKSVTKVYIEAKKVLGIKNLRLHDNRGEATSKWIQKIGRDKTRKLVTGHDSEKAFDIYDRRTTEDIMLADETVQRYLNPPTAGVQP